MTDDRRTREVLFTYRVDPGESLSQGVVAALSAVTGAPPVGPADDGSPPPLEPLYDAIDPDALDSVFSPGRRGPRPGGRVTFSYGGYVVSAHSDGLVAIERPVATVDPAAD